MKDGTVSWNWSFAQVCKAVSVRLSLLSNVLPDDLLKLTRFEFNSLKDSILNDAEWTDKSTKDGYSLTVEGVNATRTTRAIKTNISLEEQLLGARIVADKLGKAIANAKNEESAALNQRKLNNALRIIEGIKSEIAIQAKLIEDVNRLNSLPTVEMNVEQGVIPANK